MMEKVHPFDEWMSVLRRRIVLFLLISGVGIAISLFYALGLPKMYETTSVIQIETSPVSDSLVQNTDVSRAMQQLQRTEQKLMARGHLEAIITDLNLFSDLPSSSMNDKVYMLRSSTTIQQVVPPALAWRTDIVPTALTVSVRLGDPVLAAEVANRFASSVLEENKQRREERVRETLNFFESEETRVGGEISTLDAALAQFKKENAESLPSAIASIRVKLTALEESDLMLEQQLIELTSGSGENRPLIAKKIDQLEEQRAAITERIDALEAALFQAPRTEKSLNTLARRMSLLEEQYTVITRHRAEAEMEQMLEASKQSENFEVLEVAQVPEQPIAPSRKKVFAVGIVASLSIAGLLVFVLESWHPVIRTAAQMERQLGIRPVVSIPNISSRIDVTKRIFSRAMMAGALLVLLPVAAIILNETIFPISSLFDAAWIKGLAGSR